MIDHRNVFGRHEERSLDVAEAQQRRERSERVGLGFGRVGLLRVGRLSRVRGLGRVAPLSGVPTEEELLYVRALLSDVAPHGPDRIDAERRHDGPVDARQGLLQVGGREHQLELEERVPLDDVLGALLVAHAGELHDEPVVSDLLDERLLDPELVDPRANDAVDPVDHVGLGIFRHGAVRIVHLEHEVHAALKIEAQLEPPGVQLPSRYRQNDEDGDDSTPERLEHGNRGFDEEAGPLGAFVDGVRRPGYHSP
jgi:hypothetical protein